MSRNRNLSQRLAVRRRATNRPLSVEAMEARQLLTVFDVLNRDDSGPGSLRQAILDANSNPNINGLRDEIDFDLLVKQLATLSAGSRPLNIVGGPDGNVWFTAAGEIGRTTPTGTVTLFTLPAGSRPLDITKGPDGALWFTDQNPNSPAIGRITTSGAITLFPLPGNALPNKITTGPDGNLYFTDNGSGPRVGRITPAGVVQAFFNLEPLVGIGNANGITVGPDGNLWIPVGGAAQDIVRLTPNGIATTFLAGVIASNNPLDITTGPDGNLWYTDNGLNPVVGRISIDGGLSTFSLPAKSVPHGITAGPDGNLYFALTLTNADGTVENTISRITPGGDITNFGYRTGSSAFGITLGSDNQIYITEPDTGKIGQFDPFHPGTVFVKSPLPEITESVLIAGFSQLGSAPNLNTHLLNLHPTDSQLPFQPSTMVNLAEIDGSQAGPGVNGLVFHGTNGSTSNSVAEGLLIDHFSGAGIVIQDDSPAARNAEGVRIDGSTIQDNAQEGVRILSSNNVVGGTGAGLRTVIQRNNVGVAIAGPRGTGNRVEGTFIFNNMHEGVLITSSNNTIGGDTVESGLNVISGNERGVRITNANLLDGAVPQGNEVLGNRIGTDVLGYSNVPNRLEGVLIENSTGNRIGGLQASMNNVIMASGTDGVHITGASSTANRVLNNYIGFNANDQVQTVFGGNLDGVRIESPNNIIGGVQSGSRNIISDNQDVGIIISGQAASGTQIQGNYIGLGVGGATDFGNTLDGIFVDNATDTVIGGTTSDARNVISGNNWGITLNGSGTTGSIVQGNYIGIGADGVTDLGNAVDGIRILDSPFNTVGGTASGAGNVISGNNRGLRISGTNAHDNSVLGNLIGTDATGVFNVGNEIDGVLVTLGASNNPIGGLEAGAGNAIAFNSGEGVRVESGTGNPILSNRIFKNAGLGIDLGGEGVTPNDPSDADGGANDLQNFPIISKVSAGNKITSIEGDLNSTPGHTFIIQFFASDAADPTTFGEGQTFLGSTSVTTDPLGNAHFAVDLSVVVAPGQFISSTATDITTNGQGLPINDTSEFSPSLPNIPIFVQFASANFAVNVADGQATIIIRRSGGTGGTVVVSFSTSDGTAKAGTDYTATSKSVTFLPGQVSQAVTIPINASNVLIGDKTVNLSLGSPAGGATIGDIGTATLTIRGNANFTEQFSASAYRVNEGNTSAVITVTRAGGSGGTASVNFSATAGTATAGLNFNPVAGVLNFAPGETSKTFAVPILEDSVAEGNTTVNLTLSSPVGSTLGTPSSSTLTIVDNDQPGTFRLSSTAYAVSEAGGGVTITVARTAGSGGPINVPVVIGGGTAVNGKDYVSPQVVTLTFKPGEATKTFRIPVVNNALIDGNRTVGIALATPSGGGTLGAPSRAVLTIVNDDLAGTFKFAAPSLFVDVKAGAALVTVVRSNGLGGPVLVPFAVGGGTALPNVDYRPVSGALVFNAGETIKSFVVPIINTGVPGPDKTLGLFLGTPSGGGKLTSPAAAILTILNTNVAGAAFRGVRAQSLPTGTGTTAPVIGGLPPSAVDFLIGAGRFTSRRKN